jgi:chromosome segregation ATPase
MARDVKKKVKSRASTKYATSSDEENSSDDEDNLLALFANLNMQQKENLNELIGAIHEKDELLDTQEDFLIKENKKHVKVKNSYAQELEKCEKLTNELSTCHDTISNLRNENAKLIAKVENLNVCDDSLVKLKNDNANLIAKIDKLNESIASLKIENEKLITKAMSEGKSLRPSGRLHPP